jgi:16S rRNA (guanine966-N2)-methyltransferase
MRVIAGSARSLRLKTIDSMDTRPTTDRIKETLFNMINDRLYDCVFVDLFSGSGAIGIEALSRGAKKAYFCDNNKLCIDVIKENLRFTHLEERAVCIKGDCQIALDSVKSADIIFMDPPYEKNLERGLLEKIAKKKLLCEDGLIIIEASLKTTFDYMEDLGYNIIKVKEYKTNKHVFAELKG